jgi:NADPH-dependent glutamate synthase beta subunit-like oxidoreductase
MSMHEQLKALSNQPRHVVVIVGGAVSGSEAAAVCAERELTAIVLEQNPRPYGKIEDGLPRWHDKLRAQEYKRIDENLARPSVFYLPNTKLGRDLSLEDLTARWGASVVLLANGAWRDRPLPVRGAEQYVGRGLVYQNPFVYWFNHYEEPGYDGPRYEVHDGAIVVGGGLASVDVVKIINLELYRSALRRKGIEVSVVDMEHKGISATLAQHKIDADALGVQGCTLYYRRRIKDMPLAFPKAGAGPDQIAKTELVREKMVKILEEKFRVRTRECSVPIGVVAENGRLVGLRFRRSEQRDGKLVELPGSEFEVRAPLVVSSIGSVPEVLPAIPTKGELYDFTSWESGALRGLQGVFGLGNVLTGKGNIRDSRENAEEIAAQVIRDYLGLGEEPRPAGAGEEPLRAAREEVARATDEAVHSAIRRAKAGTDKLSAIAEDVERCWQRAGYDGDYKHWMDRHRPLF